MDRRLPFLIFVCAALAAAPCRAQPRFQLSADTVLVDESVGIALTGLPPGREVTVRLSGEGPARGWRASAAFRADEGRVDLARAAPVSGDYAGVHAMGLFWSARRDSAAAPLLGALRTPDARHPPAQPWALAAEMDGRVVAADTVWRRAVAPDVRVEPVRERGLVGTAYYPPGEGRRPAVVVLNGSQGGIAPPGAAPGGLASRGYVVLALGYFAAEGLPERLAEIPLEYFGTALRWLAGQPSVDPERIGVLGASRGGELALLLGATYPEVRAVVAYAPSHVVWPGTITDAWTSPAWTLGGRALPGMHRRASPAAVARHAGCRDARDCAPLAVHQFLALLDDADAAARAEIPVERIDGPVLLVSGRDDLLWPSALMAERVVARLRRRGFRHPVEHLSYPGAGHSIGRPYLATSEVGRSRPHPITGRMITPGGTPEGTALASEDSWRRVLEFLDANLRRR
ncbi:MAG TPA: acyl-CoA thioester hydrolase/BAAT C-terminal domain-containing protein [Longimicrobium sp.]|jgi:dienelactone hydrolase